jgi:DNA polymerase I-like protein with 3'-5' exonuclease and polymerase domains
MVFLNDTLPPGSRLVASFHDELIIECPESEAPIVKALLQEAMELSLGKMIPGIPVVVNMTASKTLG